MITLAPSSSPHFNFMRATDFSPKIETAFLGFGIFNNEINDFTPFYTYTHEKLGELLVYSSLECLDLNPCSTESTCKKGAVLYMYFYDPCVFMLCII